MSDVFEVVPPLLNKSINAAHFNLFHLFVRPLVIGGAVVEDIHRERAVIRQ